MNDTVEFIKNYCKLEDYCAYVILGIARKKNNKNITNSQEVVFREVITKIDHVEKKYNKLKLACDNYTTRDGDKLNFYLYMSVNPRDTRKCYWTYMNDLLRLGKDINLNDSMVQLARLDKRWYTALMQRGSKFGRGLFMLDIDTKEPETILEISKCLDCVTLFPDIYKRETKNGWHFMCEPFNKQKFETLIKEKGLDSVCEVKIDSLLFLENIEV